MLSDSQNHSFIFLCSIGVFCSAVAGSRVTSNLFFHVTLRRNTPSRRVAESPVGGSHYHLIVVLSEGISVGPEEKRGERGWGRWWTDGKLLMEVVTEVGRIKAGHIGIGGRLRRETVDLNRRRTRKRGKPQKMTGGGGWRRGVVSSGRCQPASHPGPAAVKSEEGDVSFVTIFMC